jgi:hypothetical protein
VDVLREKASTVFGPSGFERKKAAPVGTNGVGVGAGVGVGVVATAGWDFDCLESGSFLQAAAEKTKASVNAKLRSKDMAEARKLGSASSSSQAVLPQTVITCVLIFRFKDHKSHPG